MTFDYITLGHDTNIESEVQRFTSSNPSFGYNKENSLPILVVKPWI